jgi:hypothetical protein
MRRRTIVAAQGIQQIDAEIAEKGHFWMETRLGHPFEKRSKRTGFFPVLFFAT